MKENTAKKKKVLFVATVDLHIETFHVPSLKMFHDKGWEVHVATDTDKKIPYCDKKIELPIKRSPFRLVSNWRAVKKLRKVMEREKYSIVHCHTPVGGVVARLAGKKLCRRNTRMIYTAHGFHFYTGAPLYYWMIFYPVEWYLAKYTDTMITINGEDYKRAKNKFKSRCKNIQYIPGMGVESKVFEKKMDSEERNKLRKSIGLNNDDKVLIFPAELNKNKNQILLIDAMEELVKRCDHIKLLLPGRDSMNGYYQRIVKRRGLENNIKFLGHRRDVASLLKISDIGVSSSLREGLGLNLIESLFAGNPVIAYDNRGHRDIVENGVNGYLITDGLSLAKCVVAMDKKPLDENRIRKSAEKYSLNCSIKALERIYFE